LTTFILWYNNNAYLKKGGKDMTGLFLSGGYVGLTIAVFIIAHTKVKEMEDAQTGEKYEMITNNLDSRFYNPIADTAQMVVNIVVDRKIVGAGTEKKKVKDKEIEVAVAGKQTSNERIMYFRDNNFVDAGGRFEGLPEKLPLSAENFILAFETGVKNSQKTTKTKKELAELKQNEENENKKNGEKNIKKEKTKILTDITSLLGSGQVSEDVITAVREKLVEYNIKSFKVEDLENVTIEQLRDIHSLFD
jgi:stringent starvation protein B